MNGISQRNNQTISASKRDMYRTKAGIPNHCKLVVGAIGRMTADREPWTYLPIFKEIANEFGHDVHFLLAGGGSELNRMRSLAIEYGLEKQVHFPGEVNETNNVLCYNGFIYKHKCWKDYWLRLEWKLLCMDFQ